MTDYFVLLVETGANQRFLFETNKLAESVGGSELIHQVTNEFAEKPLAHLANGAGPDACRFEEDGMEVLVRTSGKLLVLFAERDHAASVLYEVTERALVDAPGLEVYGAVAGPFVWGFGLHDAIGAAHREANKCRGQVSSANSRFLRLPPVSECDTSGLPGAEFAKHFQTEAVRSHSVLGKIYAAQQARDRGAAGPTRLVTAANIGDIVDRFDSDVNSDNESWIAVIHADGNGFGQLVIGFNHSLPPDVDDRCYADAYRDFSQGLQRVADQALEETVSAVWSNDEAWLVPLIVGGDDLTVVCEGAKAKQFTETYLREFEKQINESPPICERAREFASRVTGSPLGADGRITAAAGVAYTKPHYPFALGYRLAEELTKSAKKTKHRQLTVSSWDFHVLFDSVASSLEVTRSRMMSHDGFALWGGPYLIDLDESVASRWGQVRRVERLDGAIAAVERTADGRRMLPSSQLHALRDGLRGPEASREYQVAEMRRRYPTLDALLTEDGRAVPLPDAGTDPAIDHDENSLVLDAVTLAGVLRNADTGTPRALVQADSRPTKETIPQ